MSFPVINDPGPHHHPSCSHYENEDSAACSTSRPHGAHPETEDIKLVDEENRMHEANATAQDDQPDEAEKHESGLGKADDEEFDENDEHQASMRKLRSKSFSREFPDIPALEFDSEGDQLDPAKPKLRWLAKLRCSSLRIRAVTWNIAGRHPKEDLTLLLGLKPLAERKNSKQTDDVDNAAPQNGSEEEPEADLIFIGFQELSANPMAPVMETVVMSEIWQSTLKRRLSVQNYILLQSIRLQGIILVIFCKTEHLRQIRNLETAYLRLGASGWWGNKGAVGISFEAYGTTICVIDSHLSAHDHAFEDRVRNYGTVLADLVFPRRGNVSTILEHDYAIWMGDFNFRIEGITQDKALYYIRKENYPKLLKHDQLRRAAFVKGAFSTFREGKISFPPTYKFVEGRKSIYDMRNPAKIRRPSYCDRILWRGLSKDQKIRLVDYQSYMDYKISDHKPVSCVLEISLDAAKEEFVTFEPLERWYVGENGRFAYSAQPGVHYSSWDWIGLYKENYDSFNDYVTYVWSPGGGNENSGYFNGRYITKPGRYILIYFSSEHKCGIGFSEPFEVYAKHHP